MIRIKKKVIVSTGCTKVADTKKEVESNIDQDEPG